MRSLTIREGKAFAGFDENPADEGLSCILPGRARQKARDQVGANTLVIEVSSGLDGGWQSWFLSDFCRLTPDA